MKNDRIFGYLTMGAFVVIGMLYLSKKDYATAAMNIAIGVALGGSGVKSWNEVHPFMKAVTIALVCLSIGLFVFIIFKDLSDASSV